MLTVLTALAAFLGLGAVWDAAFAAGMLKGQGVFPLEMIKQCAGLVLAITIYFCVSAIPKSRLKRVSIWIFWLSLIGCVLVFVPGLGQSAWGARRRLGGDFVGIQPAEMLKPATIGFLAYYATKSFPVNGSPLLRFLPRCWPIILMIAAFVLVEREPDMGTALILLSILFGMLLFGLGKSLFGGNNLKVLVVMVIVGVAGLSWMAKSKDYRADRMANHANRWDADKVDGPGFQTTVAEKAMAIGGPLGVGIGKGMAKHVLPAATTDFICVTMFEEFGIIGSLAVVALLGAIAFRLLLLATFINDPFGRLVLQGTGWWIATQSIFNLLVAGSAIPPVGIPLPFFSYGSSSLVAIGVALGFCRSIMTASKPVGEAARANSDNRGRDRWARISGS
jgi:cell division protein FtsW